MATPTYAGTGLISTGGSPTPSALVVSPGAPDEQAAGHILLWAMETANTGSIPVPAGYQLVDEAGVGTPESTDATKLSVFWRRATGTAAEDPPPTITVTTNHFVARITAWAGCVSSGTPWNTRATTTVSSPTTAVSYPGVTTTNDNCLIVNLLAYDTDGNNNVTRPTPTNASLSSIQHFTLSLSTTSGNGGGMHILYGPKSSAGSVNSTTYTLTTAAVQALMTIALSDATTSGGATVSPLVISDSSLLNGQTGVTITMEGGAAGFGVTQGTGFVKICPTNDIDDVSGVLQTVNGWGDTSINITAVRGAFAHSTNVYLFVQNNDGNSNTSGLVIQFSPNRLLKVLTDASAASATGVKGVVFAVPTGGNITGTEIGEFSGRTFEASLESGNAVLKVNVIDFGGQALTTSDTPVVLVRNTTHTTGIISATIIEE